MLIRGRVSWCSSVPAVALVGVTLIVLASAAPVTKDKITAEESVAKVESDRPLVRAKRADEIIFDNEQNAAASPSVGSSPVKKADQQTGPKSDDVTISAGRQLIANNEPEVAQKAADESVGNGDSDSSESSDNSASDSADSGSWDSDSDDADKRRRRSALDSEVKTEAAADRTKRAASAAMVSENMAVAGTGNSRLQRAKRDLDADEIREIFEAEQPMVGSVGDVGRGPDYAGSDYGSPRDLADDTPADDGEEEDEDGNYEYDDGEEEEVDDEAPEMKYVGRPKRRSLLTEEEREEALEEAERQVVRELLAERAAEETRQALINYLTGFEAQQSEPLRIVERGDARFREEGYEEGFDGDDEDGNDEEDGYEEDEENAESDGGQEELIEDGDGRFLVGEGPDGSEIEEQSPSIVEQKRFSYPYSYEPYGGRWGALLPGAKRDDHDPYDRLYQLAEALSRPSSIGGSSATDDEYKK